MMKRNDVICENEQRRYAIRQQAADWNGLDYLEVSAEDPTILVAFFINKAPAKFAAENVIIEGGKYIDDIQVRNIEVCRRAEADRDDCLVVYLNKFGDHSTYTLRLVAIDDTTKRPLFDIDSSGKRHYRTMQGIDPLYDRLEFTFQAGCPTDMDCLDLEPVCPPELPLEPEIDYLAKDYASFRRLILNRLALIMPDWQEQHIPDIGITLVELLAYVGDYLSQYQDAVATEAYLQTARERISVHRHARLVDYRLHEGCNARAWLHIHTAIDWQFDPQQVAFVTGLPGKATILTVDDLRKIPAAQYELFEPLPVKDPIFTPRDLKGLASEAQRRRSIEPLMQAIGSRSLAEPILRHRDLVQQRQTVVDILNMALWQRRLYDEKPFKEAAIQLNVLRPVPDEKRIYYNRRVLEEAFPGLLVRHEWIHLYGAHNEIHIYTWGDRECCLPSGSTAATLKDSWMPLSDKPEPAGKQKQTGVPDQHSGHDSDASYDKLERPRKLRLQPGDFLLFEEIRGPKTGSEADHDPNKRHVVRLTRVERIEDKLCDQPLLAVEWDVEDALPFALCITAVPETPLLDELAPGEKPCNLLEISVARGNILLVDHGLTHDEYEDLGEVEAEEVGPFCDGENQLLDKHYIAGRYRPVLKEPRLTFSQPLPFGPSQLNYRGREYQPASRFLAHNPRQALPQIDLYSIPPFSGSDGLKPLFEETKLNDETGRKALLEDLRRVLHDKESKLVLFLRRLPREVLDANTWHELSDWLNENQGQGQIPDGLKNRVEQEINRDQQDKYRVTLGTDAENYACLQFNGLKVRLIDVHSETFLRDENRRYAYLAQLLAAQGCEMKNASELLVGLERLLAPWKAQPDLLGSTATDPHFVVEVDNRRHAHLRFGNGNLGLQPPAGARFVARYRTGNGPAGNVGAETITHIVTKNMKLSGIHLELRNPLPAKGGTVPESLEEAKHFAPYAFKTRLERAITPEDYVQLVMRAFNRETAVRQNMLFDLRSDSVQRAAATLRWNGSWYEARVAVDTKGAVEASDALLEEIAAYLRDFKRMGHDLKVVVAHYMPVDVTLEVCVLPDYLQAHVKRELLDKFSNRRLSDGITGFFHPDRLSFGQGIRLSHLVALAQNVPGVENVTVLKLQRHGEPAQSEIEKGILPIGPLEIARLDNDPDAPENGVFELEMVGGR